MPTQTPALEFNSRPNVTHPALRGQGFATQSYVSVAPKFRIGRDAPLNLRWIALGDLKLACCGGTLVFAASIPAGGERGVAMGYKYRNPQNRMRAAALLRHLKGQLIDVTGVRIESFSNNAASAEAYWQLISARWQSATVYH